MGIIVHTWGVLPTMIAASPLLNPQDTYISKEVYIKRYIKRYIERYIKRYIERYIKRYIERYIKRYIERYIKRYIERYITKFSRIF
jgi:predicted metal-dependent hydrolase